MNRTNTSTGFTLFELLITLVIIGIVSAVAIPAYQGYIATANMTRVTANFEESIRIARNTFTNDESRLSLGLAALAPTNKEGWIALFSESGAQAPGGGAAYVDKKKNIKTTGAIQIKWKDKKSQLEIKRPGYLELVEQTVKITSEGIKIKK